MTKILGLSGKKQCGKTTTCNFLFGMEMVSLGLVNYMKVDDLGRLNVPVDIDGEIQNGLIDPVDPRPEVQEYYAQTIWPFLKIYQLADLLKWTCQNILGLTNEQCNGSNEDKETETHLHWENMLVPRDIELPDRFMTAREVMQYVGTQIFRKMYSNVWIDATIRRIQQEGPELAIVSDVRFPNEVEGIQNAGGKVIRFTRDPFKGQDQHASETALDDYPSEKFDAIIENDDVGIPKHNELVHNHLMKWKYLNYDEVITQ